MKELVCVLGVLAVLSPAYAHSGESSVIQLDPPKVIDSAHVRLTAESAVSASLEGTLSKFEPGYSRETAGQCLKRTPYVEEYNCTSQYLPRHCETLEKTRIEVVPCEEWVAPRRVPGAGARRSVTPVLKLSAAAQALIADQAYDLRVTLNEDGGIGFQSIGDQPFYYVAHADARDATEYEIDLLPRSQDLFALSDVSIRRLDPKSKTFFVRYSIQVPSVRLQYADRQYPCSVQVDRMGSNGDSKKVEVETTALYSIAYDDDLNVAFQTYFEGKKKGIFKARIECAPMTGLQWMKKPARYPGSASESYPVVLFDQRLEEKKVQLEAILESAN